MKTLSQDALIVAPRQELVNTILSMKAEIEKLQGRLTEVEFQFEWYKRQMFGQKTERFIPSNDLQTQLELGTESNPPVVAKTQTVSYERTQQKTEEVKKGHGRGPMPTHLPYVDVYLEPTEDVRECVCIGEEVTWEYEVERNALKVKRYIRKKYARLDDNGVAIAELPARPIEKGNAGPGFMAQVTIDKFVYHIPLDRQRKKFKNEYNVDFSESWLSDIVKHTAFWVEPVYNTYVRNLLMSTYIQADETPIQVLTTDHKGKTHRGYFWVYHDPLNRIVLFDYRKSRSSDGPQEFLKDFKGVLQVDGYEGYNPVIISKECTRAACMDHVRRKFEYALDYDKVRCSYALEIIGTWYKVEREAKENELSLDERFTLRTKHSVPSMENFKKWLNTEILKVLPKSPIGNALSYALNQWPYFKPFMTDSRIELSNILIENAIRPVAIGRKNYMFKGSHEAAQRAAMIYSLTSIAKNHGYDPFIYFKDLLSKLPKAKSNQIDPFLIPNWKPE